MPKKILTAIIAFVCLSMSCVWSQDDLSAFREALKHSDVTFSYEFRAVKGNVPMTGSGKAYVSDVSFRVEGNGVEIISNGKETWVIDREAEEAVVESVEPTVAGLLSNPVLLITAFDKFFNVDSGSKVKGGTEYVFSPKERKSGITGFSLTISGQTVSAAKVTLNDGTITDFTISQMTYVALKPELFAFDEKSLGSNWVITDMR